MITIHITEKQFKCILERLDKTCSYYKPNESTIDEMVSWIKPDFSKFSIEIGVLEYAIDDRNTFPLLFFKDHDNSIRSIKVSYNPKFETDSNLTLSEKKYLIEFVKRNVETLYLISHGYIDTMACMSNLDFTTTLVLNEMSTLRGSTIGLPTDLWLDTAQLYKKGGRGPRLKFRNNNSGSKTTDFYPITISDNPTVVDTRKKVSLKNKDLNIIKSFIKLNKDLLLSLIDSKISYHNDFIPLMYRPDKSGKFFSHKTIRYNYEETGLSSFGIAVVKSKDGLYNYYSEDNKCIISDYWFDTAIEFMRYGSEIRGRGSINGFWYDVDINGIITYIGK